MNSCQRNLKVQVFRTNSYDGFGHVFVNEYFYRNIESTLRLQKDILRCTTRFYFNTIVVPYLCQRHASDCKIKSIFIWQ